MPNDYSYAALLRKHGVIEAEISQEMKRPLPNTLNIQRLKRQKLLLKDQLESWKRLMQAVRAPLEGYSGGAGAQEFAAARRA